MPPTIPRIIAISGVKRSGKDTAACFIADAYGYQHVKFAGKLKECCKLLFGLTEDQLEGDMKEVADARWNETPRRIMQFFGTELMQHELQRLLPHIGRSFWAKNLLESHPTGRIVISDLRFAHEAQAVLECDPSALIIRIERAAAPHDDAHSSEADLHLVPYHALLHNNGSVSELQESLGRLLGPRSAAPPS